MLAICRFSTNAHGKQRLFIVRVRFEHHVGTCFGIAYRCQELRAHGWIGVHLFLLIRDLVVVGEELALQNVHPVELIEEVRGRTERIR
jgi:hypothetical protein